ncbi:phosphatase [Streptomyces niveiscabiei]|uniref:phosphatase n=1 Tax=Streptomyces niveiscabiei TaxID=164115 RepID=UPI0029B81827|nr:phosphatase [Streptomyces niveiscabiei]MDX3387502.1 phosphatase [Streptomyces niveiscabiei]
MFSVEALVGYLVDVRISGRVSTLRERSLRNYRLFGVGDPRVTLGVVPRGVWGVGEVLGVMVEACGVSDDLGVVSGQDWVEPLKTVAALDAFADRIRNVALCNGAVLVGTGHPGQLGGFYRGIVDALSTAGCEVLTPAKGLSVDITTRFGLRTHILQYVRGVGRLLEPGVERAGRATGVHTHSPLPVRLALEALAASGGRLPDLVIGDHGWVCGAGQLGFEAIGLADADDPAVFVGQAEGIVSVAVPVDDGVRSDYYLPLTRYVLNRACLSQ